MANRIFGQKIPGPQKVDRAQEGVGLLYGLEVEVAQDHPEQGDDRLREGPEVVALFRQKMTQLLHPKKQNLIFDVTFATPLVQKHEKRGIF